MNRLVIKLAVAVSLVLVLFSCSKMDSGFDEEENITRSETIPVEIALEQMKETINSLSIHTKSTASNDYDFSDIIVIGNKSFAYNTKAGESIVIPDTLLYVVNFSDDEGFAVLSADKRIPSPVLCITESGNIKEYEFENAMRTLLTKSEANSNSFSEAGEEFVTTLILASVLPHMRNSGDVDRGGEGGGEGGGGDGGEGGNDIDYDSDYPFLLEPYEMGGVGMPPTLGPYVMTKWGQNIDPFNRYTPNHYRAGCSCIALAQLMVANQFSNTMVFNGMTCDWDYMGEVYNYLNYQDALYNGSSIGKEQVANFMVGLGSSAYLNLDYTETGSHPHAFLQIDWGGAIKNAMESLGYTASKMHNLFSFTDSMKMKTYDMLREGRPVIVQGTEFSTQRGHVWLVDGYSFVTNMNYSGHFFHINWGWFGDRDGYYNLGVFNTGNGVYSHSVYDDSALLQTGPAINFNVDFAIIDYSFE